MTDFDEILDRCLDEIASGASNLDECLLRHPEHAAQLKPLLESAAHLHQGREVRPSAAFKARTRAQLTLHMQAHPRAKVRSGFVFWRLTTSLAVIILALLSTGTVYAQGALPGDPFYEWKRASEHVWRAVSPDPVGTDIALANRRIDEMNAVSEDPVRKAEALEGYWDVVTRLESELDAETLKNILPVVDVEQSPLKDSKDDSKLPAPTPTSMPTPVSAETAIQQTEIIETPLPQLPEIIPTIEIPSLIR
jgi:hypothetical protein